MPLGELDNDLLFVNIYIKEFGMGINVLRCFEYSMVCDICGSEEVLHTNDHPEEDICVHNINTAIKGAGYHRSKGRLLCDDCFNIFGGKV